MTFRVLTDRRPTGTDYPSGPRAMRSLCWTRKMNVSGKGEARRERSEQRWGAALSSHDQVSETTGLQKLSPRVPRLHARVTIREVRHPDTRLRQA